MDVPIATTSTAITSSILDPAMQTKIKTVFLKESPIVVMEVASNENVNGIATKHLKVSIDRERFIAFLWEVAALNNSDFDAQKTGEVVDKILQATQNTIDVWIDKSATVIRKVSVPIVYTSDQGDVQATIVATFSNFNKDIAITVPTETISYEEAMQQFIIMLFGSAIDNSKTPSSGTIK